jgi:cytochrome P450
MVFGVMRSEAPPDVPRVELEVAEASLHASLGFRELQLGVIADRRSKPQQPDLISLLCHSEVNGERLDDESIVQETLLILIGGDETTRHVITCGALALMDHPDQAAILRDQLPIAGGAGARSAGGAWPVADAAG